MIRNQRIVDDNIAMMSVRVCVGECVSRSHVVSKEIVHAYASPTNHLHTNTHVTLHAMQCGRKRGEFMVGRDVGRNGSTINHADDRQESSALRRATPLPQLVSSGKRMASFCSSSARFFFSWECRIYERVVIMHHTQRRRHSNNLQMSVSEPDGEHVGSACMDGRSSTSMSSSCMCKFVFVCPPECVFM